jgi:signal transduction histidine kinase
VSQSATPSFNLWRYFSLASLIVLVIATVVVGFLSYFRAREALLRSSEDYAASIAQNLSFQLATDPVFQLQTTETGISLDAPNAPETLTQILPSRLFGLNLDKVIIFDGAGRIVFSTDASEIGEVEGENEGIALARSGQTFSEYGMIPQDQRPQNLPGSFIETYTPLFARMEGNSPRNVVGVVEIYRDVTTLDSELTRSAFVAAGTVGGAMLLLYLALLLIIRRADVILSTQRHALEDQNKQLNQLQQYRDDLTNMVVHDLRNPLTSIIGNLSMLQQDSAQFDPEQQAMVTSSMSSSEEVMTMLNDLLSVNKMEQGQIAIKREAFGAADWLRARASRLESMSQRQGIRLSVQVAPQNLQIHGDKQLLSRVVDNLVTNALHHTDKGGEIRLLAERNDDNETVITVQDNGEGIEPADVPHVFDKFYRADSNTRHTTGAGLGLAFCKLAVQAHNGRIWVESKKGQGSAFSFTVGKAA